MPAPSLGIAPAHRRWSEAHWLLGHFAGRSIADRILGRRVSSEREGHGRILRERGQGRWHQVDALSDLTPQCFRQDYVRPALPVVFKGAASGWRCTEHWTPRFFAERYGEQPVLVMNADKEALEGLREDGADHDRGTSLSTLRQIVEDAEAGVQSYARFNPVLFEHPELVDDFNKDWLQARKPFWAHGNNYQLFLGAAGSNTVMHSAVGSNLFVQVYGRKEWFLYPGEYASVLDPAWLGAPYFVTKALPERKDGGGFPLLKHLDGYRVTLEPGDVLYVPPLTWHRVVNPEVSLGVGVRWVNLRSCWRSSPLLTALTLAAYNPTALKGARMKKDFARIYARMSDAT